MGTQGGISRFIRSLGGYALLLNVLTLVVIFLTLRGHTTVWTSFLFWVVLAVAEFVTRGHVTTLLSARIGNVLAARTDVPVLGTGIPVRILGAVLAIAVANEQASPLADWLLVLWITLVLLLETTTSALARKAAPSFANVPWQEPLPEQPKLRFYTYVTSNLAIAFGMLISVSTLFTLTALVLVSLSAVMQIILIVNSMKRMRAKQRFNKTLATNLRKFRPKFYFYWDAPEDTVFQAQMWIPYLERLEQNFCIILRNTTNFEALSKITDAPIIVRTAMADLDELLVPSLKVAFYVNNAVRNAHFARFLGVTHIQLNHGDSDKPPSFNPVMRMYDRNFVAGNAAIERYASRGIETSPNFFEIVGRPQIEEIQQVSSNPNGTDTVVYAPTWAGFMADTALSSLPIGPIMIDELIARSKRVIFRPHPHARKSPALAAACNLIIEKLAEDNTKHGRGHLYGPEAESKMTIVECFNASDAMIADVSSVVPDYLYSGKPFTVVAMGSESISEFIEENPVAKASYILKPDASNLQEVFDGLLKDDQLIDTRRRMRDDYLGTFDTDRYSQRFIDVATKYLL